MKFPDLIDASWISSPSAGGVRTMAPAPYFRKEFTLDAPIVSAKLLITALGVYECEVNGQKISAAVFAPGWTDYRKRIQVQVYDLSAQLNEGSNALGIILGDGWYCGRVGWEWRQRVGDRPQAICALLVTLVNGRVIRIVSDDTWRTTNGPILENDLIEGETYDARLELGRWSEPAYDESAWSAVAIQEPTPHLFCDTNGPQVRRQEQLEGHFLKTRVLKGWPVEKAWIYDLGQNIAGRIRIRVKAARGRTLRIRHAEVLASDGLPYYDNLRGARATDFYTCKGSEEEVWEPRFTFHGFRYVSVVGLLDGDALEIKGIVLHSEMQETGHFACSNKLLNQLSSNIAWGLKGNFIDVPTDCPQRDERLGWTGDAQAFIRTACFYRNVRTFFHKWLRDMRDAQHENGLIPPVVPEFPIPGVADGGPAWSDAVIICPWTLYLCYADEEILKDHYPAMQKYLDFIENERCLDSIRCHPDVDPWGGFGDWLAMESPGENMGRTPPELIATAFFAEILRIMERVATIRHRPEDAIHYGRRREEVVLAFQSRFLTPQGLVVSNTQTAYVLALAFGLVPETLRSMAAKELVRDIRRRNNHLSTGFVGTPHLLFVLEQEGYLEVAYELLEQETFPSWLYPIKNGATTVWERWDGWTPEKGFQNVEMNSFNHYAYGAVGAWMVQSVAGIEADPDFPGYERVILRPRPGGSLKWAEARLQTRFGRVAIHWELNETDHLILTFEVPKGSTALLSLPAEYGVPPQVFTTGTYRESFGKMKE